LALICGTRRAGDPGQNRQRGRRKELCAVYRSGWPERGRKHQARTVAGVSDGIQIGHPALDQYGNTLTRLLGDKGSVAILIHVFVPAHIEPLAPAAALLRSQAARL